MEIPALPNAVHAADLQLEQLAKNPKLSEKEKIGELSRQFEAVLLRQILQEAHKTTIKSSVSEDSSVTGMYQDMVTNALAESISKTGSFGLAKSLEKELSRQLIEKEPEDGTIEN